MDKKDYLFMKRTGRTAYEAAIRDAVGGGGQPLPDVDQHRHPDYSLVDHEHEEIEHYHPDYQTQIDDNYNRIDHNEDRINALEHELEALAETKDAGEWELGDDPNQEGIFNMTQTDFTQATNTLAINSVDTEGVSHGFARVEVGDYVEVVEEHDTRGVGDYGLYEITAVGVNQFTCRQEQGRGSATAGSHFLIKFFHLNENLDLADLDDRYAQQTHSHNYINSDKDTKLDSTVDNPYVTIRTSRPKDADGNWYDGSFGMEIDLTEGNTYKNQFVVGSTQNDFALKVLGGTGREVWIGGPLSQKGGDKTNPKEDHYITRKNLNDAVEGANAPPPGRPFVFGSAPKVGEFYADNSGNVYFNREDKNGLVRVMPTYPDFTWYVAPKITIWDNESGYLKYACEAGKSTDFNSDTMAFKNGKLLYNKGLSSGKTYYIVVEGYW